MKQNAQAPDKEPKLIDTNELCERVDITPVTACHWRQKGILPFLKIGDSIRYDWDQVVVMMRENANKTGDAQ